MKWFSAAGAGAAGRRGASSSENIGEWCIATSVFGRPARAEDGPGGQVGPFSPRRRPGRNGLVRAEGDKGHA